MMRERQLGRRAISPKNVLDEAEKLAGMKQ
jgi:hypothetical protein